MMLPLCIETGLCHTGDVLGNSTALGQCLLLSWTESKLLGIFLAALLQVLLSHCLGLSRLLHSTNDICVPLHRWKMAVKVRMGEKEILQSMKQAVVMLMMAQEEDEEDSDEDEDDLDDDEIGDGKPADVLSAQMQSCCSMLTVQAAACMWCSTQSLLDDGPRKCSICMRLQLWA